MLIFSPKVSWEKVNKDLEVANGGIPLHPLNVDSHRKTIVRSIISELVDIARKKGIVCETNKNGNVGKVTRIGKISINLRKYAIDIDMASFIYEQIEFIDVDNFLLIIKTARTSMAVQLT